jgi:hypothetical protein
VRLPAGGRHYAVRMHEAVKIAVIIEAKFKKG